MKGYILTEIPVSCEECDLSCPEGNFGLICRAMMTTVDEDVVDEYSKPEWCPIKPLPEKYEVCGKYPQPGPVPSYRIGWNDCIDKITEEEE